MYYLPLILCYFLVIVRIEEKYFRECHIKNNLVRGNFYEEQINQTKKNTDCDNGRGSCD